MLSFEGRTDRLHFFFWELGSSIAMLALAGMASRSGALPVLLLFGVPIAFLRSAAASRRANDAGIGRWWPRLYASSAAFGLLSAVVLTWLGQSGATGATFMTIAVWAYLQWVPSKDAPATGDTAMSGGIAAMSDADLLARAAELRPSEPQDRPVRAKPTPAVAAPGFGRRAQPTFGKRA